jgi:FG-GAP-like repeat
MDLIQRLRSLVKVFIWLKKFVVILACATPVLTMAAPSDLSGDFKSDLIFRNNSTGQINAWLMNGSTLTADAALVAPGNWTVSHTADFNGDGKADILYRNEDGTVAVWLMSGLTSSSQTTLLGANPDWRVTHVGDFNGDGKADLLWQNTNGAVTIWLMNGGTVMSAVGVLGANPEWTVTHVADFNGDGKADLLWRNTNGAVTIWLMNGGASLSAVGILGPTPDWRVSHTPDLNGDGKADLLWRSIDGTVAAWLMNGTAQINNAALLGANPDWSVSHTADFNGDGRADLLWRNSNGAVSIWQMNGLTNIGAIGLLGADPNWRVSHIGDYNGDGRSDVVWRNAADGSIAMWLIDGATVISKPLILGGSPWAVLPSSVVGVPIPGAIQPTLIEATTYSTFNCPDKYCVHLTGFNFASNSYVEVYRGDTEFLGALTPFNRAKNGEADFVEVSLTTAAMKSAINAEVPQFKVFIVNPGSTPAKDGPKQVYRTGLDNAVGYVDNYAGVYAPAVSGAFIQGWGCFNDRPGTTVVFRQGSVNGPVVGTTFANLPGNATVGGLCGGNGNKYFNWRWPDIYRDGQTRQVYASLNLGEFMNAVPNNILLLNSPLTVTLPNVPRKAQFSYIQAPTQMTIGGTYRINVAYKNIGSVTWTNQEKYSLGQLTTNVWGSGYLPIQQSPVPPGYNGLFSFDVVAPANQGNYLMQWSMIQEGIEWFGDWTVPVFVQVGCLAAPPCTSTAQPRPVVSRLLPPGPPPNYEPPQPAPRPTSGF